MTAKRLSDFTEKATRQIAQRAMFICSSPECYRLTGYGTSEGKARSIAEAAHMLAASKKGPRAKLSVPIAALKTAANGIWLCKICHQKIDNDEASYSVDQLRRWKLDHEDVIRRIVGKDLEAAILSLRERRQYHHEAREIVSFLENKRVLYEGFDFEFPPRVLDSLDLIRQRLILTRAHVSPDSTVFAAMNRLQEAIDGFLRNLGADTNLRTLRCNSSDPAWQSFAAELVKLRRGIVIIIKVVADDADYKLSWLK